jgi:hypothetical protein
MFYNDSEVGHLSEIQQNYYCILLKKYNVFDLKTELCHKIFSKYCICI